MNSAAAVSVYETGKYFADARTPALVGCYPYDTAHPMFGRTLGRFDTVHEAAKQAARHGFELFGMHTNGTCVAGRLNAPFVAPQPALVPCDGTNDRHGYNLGGPASLAVYRTDSVLSALRPNRVPQRT